MNMSLTNNSSHVIERLVKRKQKSQFVSFFLFRFDDADSLKAGFLIRSLVRQLLSAVVETNESPLAPEFSERLQEARSSFFSVESLMRLYTGTSSLFSEWFIVLDGVDECHLDEQGKLYDFFQSLIENWSESQPIKIMISSRETAEVAIDRHFSVSRVTTGYDSTSADIKAYVQDILQSKLDSATNPLIVEDRGIIDEIVTTILSKEEGM